MGEGRQQRAQELGSDACTAAPAAGDSVAPSAGASGVSGAGAPSGPDAAGRPRPPRLGTAGALALLDASTDAVLVIDESTRCVHANASAERLFERSAADLVGVPAHTLVPHLADAVRALVARRARGERAAGAAGEAVDLVAVRPDATRFPARVWLTPVVTPRRLRRRLLVAVTVADLSGPQASASASRALLQDVHDLRCVVAAVCAAVREQAVLVTDAQGHLTVVNRAAEKLLDRTTEELVGRPLAALSDPEDLAAARRELRLPDDVDPLLELTRSGLPNHQHWSLLDRSGERRPVELRITAIGDHAAPIGFVCLVTRRVATWEPLAPPRQGGGHTSERLLLDLDDAETRALRWQVGGSGSVRRR